MKIQCLLVVLCLASANLVESSSIMQNRGLRLRSQKSLDVKTLVSTPNSTTTESPGQTEGQGSPDIVEQTARWSGVSNINVEFTLLCAIVWVLMLGSAPILTYKYGHKELTTSAMVLSALMWVALFGGLYLFTNIILFNSPHFDKVRSLTIIECTYFMTQVITTVGYGDITPAYPRGQVFVGAYVTLSFFVIALLMSEMQEIVMGKVLKYKQDLEQSLGERLRLRREAAAAAVASGNEEGLDAADAAPSSNILEKSTATTHFSLRPLKPPVDGLISAVAIFAGVALIWVLFFHFYPGENKAWLEAIYMSLITLTTVGFGAITPVTEGGMLFAAFFMFIGTSALLNVVQTFATFILEMNQYEAWSPKQFKADMKKHGDLLGKPKDLSEDKFLILTLLQRKMVTEDQIDAIKASYITMTGSQGKVSMKSIASNVHAQEDDDSVSEADRSRPSSRCASAR